MTQKNMFLHTFHPSPIIFSFGNLSIYWYGLFIVSGILAGLFVSMKLAKKFGIDQNKIFDLAFWLIIGGIIGARLYHIALELPYYSQHLSQIVKVWQGGLAIHGAIIAGVILLYFFARKEKINFWLLAGIFTPGIALGQAIGRWGNYFNQELFGKPTNLPWGIPIDLMNRPNDYLSADFFQPTFLYESLGDLAIFAILLIIALKLAKKKIINNKILILSYLILYSILRFAMEFFRTDYTPLVFGIRWPQIASVLIIIAAVAIIFWPKTKKRQALSK